MVKPILYFINGEVPTNEEFADAQQYSGKGPALEFISLPALDLNGLMLENVGVYGNVPDIYKPAKVEVKKPNRD